MVVCEKPYGALPLCARAVRTGRVRMSDRRHGRQWRDRGHGSGEEWDRPTRAGGGSPDRPRGGSRHTIVVSNEQRSVVGPRLAEESGRANHRDPAPGTGTVVPLWHRTGVSTATTSHTQGIRKYEAIGERARDRGKPWGRLGRPGVGEGMAFGVGRGSRGALGARRGLRSAARGPRWGSSCRRQRPSRVAAQAAPGMGQNGSRPSRASRATGDPARTRLDLSRASRTA